MPLTERKPMRADADGWDLGKVRYYIWKIAAGPDSGTPTGAVLKDALSSSGKLLRPRLLLYFGGMGPEVQARRERLYLLAAMTELTHLASLIHDDIVDEAPSRRGQPSIQSKYGKDAAVYAGDFLISRVFRWGAQEGLLNAVGRLAQTVEDMCAGEIGQAACRYRSDVTEEAYYANIRGKTAALFRTACGLGAAETGCPDWVVKKAEEFGEALGLLFQLRDDLLDFNGSGQTAGKETHKDFRDGIYTMPVLKALRDPWGWNALLPLMRSSREWGLTEDELAIMEQAVVRAGGVEAAWEEVRHYHRLSGEFLNELEDFGSVDGLRKVWCQLGLR